jgi:hypothetical protein
MLNLLFGWRNFVNCCEKWGLDYGRGLVGSEGSVSHCIWHDSWILLPSFVWFFTMIYFPSVNTAFWNGKWELGFRFSLSSSTDLFKKGLDTVCENLTFSAGYWVGTSFVAFCYYSTFKLTCYCSFVIPLSLCITDLDIMFLLLRSILEAVLDCSVGSILLAF